MGNCFASKPNVVMDNCTYDNTKELSFKGKEYVVKVLDIYDGDTITVAFPLFDNIWRFTIRLSEIDTCEIKSKDPRAKELAIQARDRLFQLIRGVATPVEDLNRKSLRILLGKNNYYVKLRCGDFDKYGRLLAFVYPPNCVSTDERYSFNRQLVKEKLAYTYMGATKLTEEEQIELLKK